MVEMRRGYVPDNESFGLYLMSPPVFKVALQAAYNIAASAAKLTPVGAGPAHMRDLYIVTPLPQGIVAGKEGNRRGAAQVENSSPHAAAVEFGNARSRRRRPLGTAGAMHGEFRDIRGA